MEEVAACSTAAALRKLAASERMPGTSLLTSQVYGCVRWGRTTGPKSIAGGFQLLVDRLYTSLHLHRDDALHTGNAQRPTSFGSIGHIFNDTRKGKGKGKGTMSGVPWPSLLSWLLLCDFAHFFPQHLAHPTALDLVRLILGAAHSGAERSGPWRAVRGLDADWWSGKTKPNAETPDWLAAQLEAVKQAVNLRLDAGIWSYCSSGAFSWVDMEHALCKVTRSEARRGQ